MAMFNCHGPGNTDGKGTNIDFCLADLSSCFPRPARRELAVALRADRGCVFLVEFT